MEEALASESVERQSPIEIRGITGPYAVAIEGEYRPLGDSSVGYLKIEGRRLSLSMSPLKIWVLGDHLNQTIMRSCGSAKGARLPDDVAEWEVKVRPGADAADAYGYSLDYSQGAALPAVFERQPCAVVRAWRPEKQCPQCGFRISISEQQKIRAQLTATRCNVLLELAEGRRRSAVDAGRNQPVSGSITVVVIDGQTFYLEFAKTISLQGFQQKVFEASGIKPCNQLFFHNGNKLGEKSSERWSDLGVPFGSIVHLIVVMHAVSGSTAVNGDQLTFSLRWSPVIKEHKQGRNPKIFQLQGSCAAHDLNRQELAIAHFENVTVFSGALQHSGSSGYQRPQQDITVNLSLLPVQVAYLFFTLSARDGLEAIQSPSVVLLGSAGRSLATYSPTARQHEAAGAIGGAIVLCCAVRRPGGGWIVVQCGSPCAGSIAACRKVVTEHLYEPIRRAIRKILKGPLRQVRNS